MFYLIYKITNVINGKFYIGMHQTNNINDGYMGSGKRLKLAVKKYGLKAFNKEILFIYDNEYDMKQKEKELVIIDENISYNLCDGGKGGFSYINRMQLNITGVKNRNYNEIIKKVVNAKKENNYVHSIETRKKISNGIKNNKIRNEKISNSLKGKFKSEEHKRNISKSLKKKWAGVAQG